MQEAWAVHRSSSHQLVDFVNVWWPQFRSVFVPREVMTWVSHTSILNIDVVALDICLLLVYTVAYVRGCCAAFLGNYGNSG